MLLDNEIKLSNSHHLALYALALNYITVHFSLISAAAVEWKVTPGRFLAYTGVR